MYKFYFKRLFDLFTASTILFIISPLFLIVIISMALYNKGSVFFIQERPGQFEKIFRLIKFKTMRDLYDNNGKLLPDRERVTFLGNLMRKLSLDELPQLINVIKGDMSLIGPRPLLVQYLELYSNRHKKRHDVKPGITGLAQIKGRNKISWQEKFELDIYYVENFSFLLDLKVLTLTFAQIFNLKNVDSSNTTTMELFNGKN